MEAQETRIYRFQNHSSYKEALDALPKASWVKERELGGGRKSRYMPIEIQQAIADSLFDYWNVLEESHTVVANEIIVTVKIQYQPSYPESDIYFCTGSASKAIQASKGSSVETFPKGKITNALEYCLPAARQSAISNAFMTLGNVFGRNLGRKVKDNYSLQQKPKANE